MWGVQSELTYYWFKINYLLTTKVWFDCPVLYLRCQWCWAATWVIFGWILLSADPVSANVISVTPNSQDDIYISAEWNGSVQCPVWTFRVASCLYETPRPSSYMTAERSAIRKHCSCNYGMFYWFFYWLEAGRLNLERRTRFKKNWIKMWKLSFSDLSNRGGTPSSPSVSSRHSSPLQYWHVRPDRYQFNRPFDSPPHMFVHLHCPPKKLE